MEVNNLQDLIDSRDVIKRIEELCYNPESLDEDESRELNTLLALVEQGEDLSDWDYGATLIRDSYFRDYAMDLADDIVPSIEARELMSQWPYRCIDWDQAADELRTDYTPIEFDGVTYWGFS